MQMAQMFLIRNGMITESAENGTQTCEEVKPYMGLPPPPPPLPPPPPTIKDNLGRHMLKHSNREKQFPCESCGRPFARKEHLARHAKTHTGEKPYGCELCGFHFTRQAHLTRHMVIHFGGEKPFGCGTCEKRFYRKEHLVRHERIHTGEKPYSCTMCDLKVTRLAHLNRHMKKHTPGGILIPQVPIEKPFACHICDYKCSGSNYLTKHLNGHAAGKNGHICVTCGKQFSKRQGLMQHLALHGTEKACQIPMTYKTV